MNQSLTAPASALRIILHCLLAASAAYFGSAAAEAPRIEPFEHRPAAINRILKERLDTLLPQLMRETGIDAWLVIAREYNDDPVYRSLAPEPSFTARRTTMLLFHDRGPDKGVDRITVSRYPLGDFLRSGVGRR